VEDARVHERQVKAALRSSPLAEPFFASRFSFSPYMACGHGCVYCDGRAERYWVEGEFDRDIVARVNIADRLEGDLSRLRERAPVAVGSGISDAYQPLEARLGLMRQAAEALLRHRMPTSVLTKSSLVSRDLDLWRELNAGAGFTLSVSLVFADDGTRMIFEPGASPVEERVAALRAFKTAGCGIGVYAMPLLPWISDTPEALEKLLALCRSAGVDFVIPAGLTLRPGRQKEHFLARLATAYPQLVPRYRELYGEARMSGACRPAYGRDVATRFARAVQAAGLATQVPHRLYRGRMPLYDELYVLVCHMVELYGQRGTATARLREPLARYRSWLAGRKRSFNRRRSETQEALEDELREELLTGRMDALLGNAKLAGFLREVAIGRRVFDYLRLELADPDGKGPDQAPRFAETPR
jgi:DNA repair photolyase